MMDNKEPALDEIFQQYRAACPDVAPGAAFMPTLWQKIEARRSFWWVFQGFARTAMAGCAALALVLAVLNLVDAQQFGATGTQPSYADALMADHSAEKSYYAESVDDAHAQDRQ